MNIIIIIIGKKTVLVKTERQGISHLCENLSNYMVVTCEARPMKVEHEMRKNQTEMIMIRWTCGI